MRKKWFLAAALLVLLIIALFQLDAESLLQSITQIPVWAALLLAAMQILTQLLVNLQWYKIAKLSALLVSFLDMLQINCKGAVMDSITPGVKIGGEITRAVQIKKVTGCPGEQSAAIVALQKLFSLSALFTIQLIAVGFAVGLHFIFYTVPIFFLLLFAYIFIMPHRIKARLQTKNPKFPWVRKARSFLMTLTSYVSQVRENKKAVTMLSLLSVIIWFLYPLKMYIIAVQFAPVVSFAAIAAIAFVSYMVAMLPIFPGGLGGFEGTMTGLLLAAGFLVSDAAVITILFRFVTFWLVLLLSLAYIALHKGVRSLGHK